MGDGMFMEAVRAHRHALVLTQEELAERAGVSVRCIRKIETGKVALPRQSTLRQLADALELSGEERRRFCRLAQDSVHGAGHQRSPADQSR
jgi:predicted transcriptional regulator